MLRFATLIFALSYGVLARGEVTREDRIRGAFLGLAYGDARGGPTKSLSAENVRKVYGDDLSLGAPPPLSNILGVVGKKQLRRTRIPGSVSDETQQAMALQLAYQHYPKWGPPGVRFFTRLLIDTYNQRADRGTDKPYAKAVKRLSKGVDYHRSGSPSPSSRAAARVGGVAATEYSSDLTEAVRSASLITHADHRAVMASLAVTALNSLLVQGLHVGTMRQTLPLLLEAYQDEWLAAEDYVFDRTEARSFTETLKRVLDASAGATSMREISDLVVSNAWPYVDAARDGRVHPNGDFALLGAVHAIALALRDEVEPLETLRYVSHLGRDSDTVAAIVGSLLGARFGTGWIPLGELTDRHRLERYADALVTGVPPETAPEFLARELELTLREREYQERVSTNCGVTLEP